ncbi:phage major capsid protein [Microbacterium lacticum]|uniref:Uncharacterized protein n=1 Tax=Microbacterium lacticum TaxID=33885 RepID=A0A4Y3UHJ0_9MICO|nr:hypothetical protein [Microbacterium lacticum]TQN00441.1 hypothetical protein FHX68_0535 [Microbacterium lacticum]GEB94391.1 hypothetical protein MLA01_06100 [Microbacterium lacticum]GGN17889.1 hypothetical protein GCM10009724_09600 [Microbacterium lacticum]
MTDAFFSVNVETRRIRGLLIPYGELSAPNVSGTEPVMFSAGTVTLPTDPSIVTLNEAHDQLEPRGRAVELEETAEGVVAEFEIAKTPEGDQLLAAAQQTPRPRLSAELRGLVRRGADAVSSALRGAAVVPQGAFQSAALFAALDPIEEAVDDLIEAVADVVTDTPDEAPAATDNPEGDEPEKEEDMTAQAATVPAGLVPPAIKKDTTTADGLFAAVAAVKSGNPDAVKAYTGGDALFAISTVQHSGPTTKTIGADTEIPAYVGELWKRRKYAQRFIPLLTPGTLTSYKVLGWQWDVEPEVGDYAGNTAEIPSNAVDTKPLTADAARIAGGHKIDRKYLDFNDNGVIASYFDHMTEDTARKLDAKALAAIIAAATTTAPGTVPAGIAKGLAAVVDGALGVIGTENTPAFALVSPELWRDIILSPKDDVLAYLSAGFGLEEGSASGFKILPATIGTGKVMVGAKEAIQFFQLPGAPIRVEGIDPHHGAFDPAVFAYWAQITANTAAIRSVTVAA